MSLPDAAKDGTSYADVASLAVAILNVILVANESINYWDE